jgi:hypothetical protein
MPDCGEYIGTGDKDEVAMPFISSASRKGPDRLYREMEAKSEARAQMAADQLGVSVRDVGHLKTTDMKDNIRTGDTTFIPVANDVSRAMDADPRSSGFQSALGIQASQGTRVGPHPNAGTNFIHNELKPRHSREWRAPISDNPSIGVRK